MYKLTVENDESWNECQFIFSTITNPCNERFHLPALEKMVDTFEGNWGQGIYLTHLRQTITKIKQQKQW